MDKRNGRSSSSSTTNHRHNKNTALGLGKSFSEHPYGRFAPDRKDPNPPSKSSSGSTSKMQSFLKKLKRKFMRREKMTFGSGHSGPAIVPYDSYTYSQNFEDHGLAPDEPDALARSFSARFAPSSRMFNRVQSVRGH